MFVDVVEHGAAGVADIGDMQAASRQTPNEKTVYRTKSEFAIFSALANTGNVVENPGHFCARKISIRYQAGFVYNGFIEALGLELVAERCSTAILPNNGVVDGFAGFTIPDDSGFALVGDTDSGYVVGGQVLGCQGILGNLQLSLPDGIGVVFHPARLGVDLLKFPLGSRHNMSVMIEDDGSGGSCTLIEREDIF